MTHPHVLSLVFLLSGTASLVYQVVWQRLLTTYYGVGAVSVTLIVTVYMLGLGLGALAGGHLAGKLKNRLLFYVWVELILGLFGMASPHLLSFLGRTTAGCDYTLALGFMFLFLCIPTLLMGMTLPLLVQIFSGMAGDFQRNVCFLYFINTLGAAFGALFASFVLISICGLDGAAYSAGAVNFILAGLILAVARSTPTGGGSPPGPAPEPPAPQELLGPRAFAFVFVTGFVALALEIIWFRQVGVLIKDSAYAFSTILAVYLAGIALGSHGMHFILRAYPRLDRRDLFFAMQAAIGLYVLASLCLFVPLGGWSPVWALLKASFSISVHPMLPSPGAGLIKNLAAIWSCLDIFLWPVAFCFVPTLLMGATFPLLSLLSGNSAGREGRIVGNLYFWNIMGNVAGGFAAGFVLLPHLGTERTLLFLGILAMAFLPAARNVLFVSVSLKMRLSVFTLLCGLALALAPARGGLYQSMHFPPGEGYQAYFSEGREGVVMTYVKGGNVRMYIGGSSHGGRPIHHFYNEAIETLARAQNPRRILVIGYGTGSIVETALRLPGVEKVTLVELNATVMRNLSGIPLFQELLSDSRLEMIIEDGRRYLLRHDQTYDVIMIDPLRTTTSHSGNLYSRDFFQLARNRLDPGGVFMLWTDEHKIIPATLADVFPHTRKYSYFALGFNAPSGQRDEARRQFILDTFPPRDRASIKAIGDREPGVDFIPSAANPRYPVNTDFQPITEYYLGLPLRTWNR